MIPEQGAHNEKQLAAEAAVARFVRSDMVLGLGTGSTSNYAVEAIGRGIKEGHLQKISGIPTSAATALLAEKCGIKLLSLKECPRPELAIDGADQILKGSLDLIKGHGGALLREKIIAAAAKQFIVVADSSKQTEALGQDCAVPVEVSAFALGAVEKDLEAAGAFKIVLRRSKAGEVFYSDNQNPILDCHFEAISSPKILSDKLNSIPAVLEHGLFCGLTSGVFIGKSGETVYFSG